MIPSTLRREGIGLPTPGPGSCWNSPTFVRIIDGEPRGAIGLLARLKEIGARHGIGRADLVEDRIVGMKSDATAAAMTALYEGAATAAARTGPGSLFRADPATFGHAEWYDHADAGRFIELLALTRRAPAARNGFPPARRKAEAERLARPAPSRTRRDFP